MDENKSKLNSEACGKAGRLYVAVSLFASIAGVELSLLLGHGRHDEIGLPPHIPHESRTGIEFENLRAFITVSGMSNSTATSYINLNGLV